MFIFLALLPFLVFLSIISLYRFSGRRSFLHFDLVQFIFIFIVYPVCYIWIKHFFFFLVQRELGVSMSLNEWIWIDTAISISFLYFYAFGVIHSLTKTFSLRLERDPFYDIFAQSEYFHEFLSHVGMYSLSLIAVAFVGLLSIPFPLSIPVDKKLMWGLVVIALCMGLLAYFGLFGLTDKGVNYDIYKRLVKLTYGLCFVILAAASFFFSVSFSESYTVFWTVFFFFFSLTISTFFMNSSRRIYRFFDYLHLTHGID